VGVVRTVCGLASRYLKPRVDYHLTMTMSDSVENPLVTLAFSVYSNPGAYAILIGAGVSASANIPTAWQVLTDIIVRGAELRGETIEDEAAEAWFEQKFSKTARYETVLEQFAPKPEERQRLLRGYFEPASNPDQPDDVEVVQPSAAHKAIARLVKLRSIRIIVTTNFDHLLEKALNDEGIEPTVISTAASAAGSPPMHSLDCCVFHIHGDYLYPESMRNTVEELREYPPAISEKLNQIVREYGLLIAGWSARYDPELRNVITECYSDRFTLAWIEPAGEPSEESTQIRSVHKALMMPATADYAIGRLADAVQSMKTRQARHPLTVSAVSDTAKRELSGRWTAIQLHDTWNAELENLRTDPAIDLSQYGTAQPLGGYPLLVERVEELSKVPAALVAVMTYWGNATTDEWWIQDIVRFATQPRAGGLVSLLQLRMIAGATMFYAAGVAAVASKRYEVLTRLLRLERDNPNWYGFREPAAQVLDAGRIYENIPNPNHRHYRLTQQILAEALSLNSEKLDDYWQLFEVLRLASLIIADPSFGKPASVFEAWDAKLTASLEQYPDLGSTDRDPEEIRKERGEWVRERGLALRRLADAVPLIAPHLLGHDTYAELEPWKCEIAERMCYEVVADGGGHPLVLAGFATSSTSLATALKAVSHKVGLEVRRHLFSRPGWVPRDIWLDTGLTPSETA
jgi:hypothetical protein